MGRRAFVQVRNPVAADPMSEPRPDLMALAHRFDVASLIPAGSRS